jgi:hypothetical protein
MIPVEARLSDSKVQEPTLPVARLGRLLRRGSGGFRLFLQRPQGCQPPVQLGWANGGRGLGGRLRTNFHRILHPRRIAGQLEPLKGIEPESKGAFWTGPVSPHEVHPPDAAEALDACEGADLLFVDLLATLEEPHKIAGYEKFAELKMGHPAAKDVPVVLIAPPDDYELDFMAGWPDFVFAHIRRPVTEKIFRRASTWV